MKSLRNFLIILIPVIFILSGCSTDQGETGEQPINVNITYTVYNSVYGFIGTFSESVQSGTEKSLSVKDIISQFSITDVDKNRAALRETNDVKVVIDGIEHSQIGDFVASTSQGVLKYLVQRDPDQKFDLFFISNKFQKDYGGLDTTLPESEWSGKKRFITAKREDMTGVGAQDGPEYVFDDPNFEMSDANGRNLGTYKQFNEALIPFGMVFGRIDYKGVVGDDVYTDMTGGYGDYNNNNWLGSHGSDHFHVNLFITRQGVLVVRIDSSLRSTGLSEKAEVYFGIQNAAGRITSHTVVDNSGIISPKGVESIVYYALIMDAEEKH